MNSPDHQESCRQQASAWLVRLDADEVSEETSAEFFTWLEEDETHQRAYIDAEKLWAKLAIVEHLPLAEAAAADSWLTRCLGWLQHPPTAVFGSLLVALAASLLYIQTVGPDQVRYATVAGESREILLEDGSRLHLNTDSAVVVSMDDKQRLLHLTRGEAYFDVAHDPGRPLVVRTGGGLVRVVGTRFNIRQTGAISTVTVVEGMVAVVPEDQSGEVFSPLFEAEVTLVAEQQAILRPGEPIAIPVTVDTKVALAWREGRLVYDGVKLAQVIADIDRYFPGTIKLSDPTLADLEVVGVLNLQNKSATLGALEATFNVKAVQISDQLTLIQRRH